MQILRNLNTNQELLKRDGLKAAVRHQEDIDLSTRPSDRRIGRRDSHYFGERAGGVKTLRKGQVPFKEGKHDV